MRVWEVRSLSMITHWHYLEKTPRSYRNNRKTYAKRLLPERPTALCSHFFQPMFLIYFLVLVISRYILTYIILVKYYVLRCNLNRGTRFMSWLLFFLAVSSVTPRRHWEPNAHAVSDRSTVEFGRLVFVALPAPSRFGLIVVVVFLFVGNIQVLRDPNVSTTEERSKTSIIWQGHKVETSNGRGSSPTKNMNIVTCVGNV